jgi:vacuolar-type H+-ATPase subunit I/STV1
LPDILLVLIGAAGGGVGVWLWAGRRMREQLQAELAEAARKSARAVDWAKSEAAMQLERRDQEIAALHARLDERDHSVEQVRSRLQADLALVQRERSQSEARTKELYRRADELSAQIRGAAMEGLRDLERLRAVANSLERVTAEYSAALEVMEGRLRPRAPTLRPAPEASPSDSEVPQSAPEPLRPGVERLRLGTRSASIRPLR